MQLQGLGSRACGFNMKSMEADASSLRLACTQGAVLPCYADFCEGVLRQSLLRETLRPLDKLGTGRLRAGKFPTLKLACPHRTAWIRSFKDTFSLDINRMEVSSSYVLTHCLNTPLAA